MNPGAGMLLGLAGALLAGCVSERPESTGPVDTSGEPVSIRDFSFQPPDLTVEAGTPVVWTNRDDVIHTVTADDESFDSSVLTRDQTFSLTPDRPGVFPYFCSVHPFMRATLRVTERSRPTAGKARPAPRTGTAIPRRVTKTSS